MDLSSRCSLTVVVDTRSFGLKFVLLLNGDPFSCGGLVSMHSQWPGRRGPPWSLSLKIVTITAAFLFRFLLGL